MLWGGMAAALAAAGALCARAADSVVVVTETATSTSPPGAPLTVSSTVAAQPTTTHAPVPPLPAAKPKHLPPAHMPFGKEHGPFLLQLPRSKRDEGPSQAGVFADCDAPEDAWTDAALRLNMSSVYLQAVPMSMPGVHDLLPPDAQNTTGVDRALLVRMLGSTPAAAHAFNASTGRLGTLSIDMWHDTHKSDFGSTSYVCDHLYPRIPDVQNPTTNPPSCTYGGNASVALGVAAPVVHGVPETMHIKVQLTDGSQPPRLASCITFSATVYDTHDQVWSLLEWYPFLLAMCVLALVSGGLLATAVSSLRRTYRHKAREGSMPSFVRDKLAPVALIAQSGRHLVQYPALLRFVKPGFTEVAAYTQYAAALFMLPLARPDAAYAMAQGTSWAMLVDIAGLGVRLGVGGHDEKEAKSHEAPLPRSSVLTDALLGRVPSPLRMDPSQRPVLLDLAGAPHGIGAYARAAHLLPQNLFWRCLLVWAAAVAVLLLGSLAAYAAACVSEARISAAERREAQELGPSDAAVRRSSISVEELAGGAQRRRRRPRHRGERAVQLPRIAPLETHLAALHGNMLRLVSLFHLPLTLFSVYELSHVATHSAAGTAVAVVVLVVLCVLVPAYVVLELWRTPTSALYGDKTTFLRLGPLYNTYAPGSQLFAGVAFLHSLALGVVVGVQRGTGNVQAVLVLAIEVLWLLVSTLWLPWARGALMGPQNFGFCVLRVVTACLSVLGMPIAGMPPRTKAWFTYVAVLVHVVFFAVVTLCVLAELIEAVVRLVLRVPFDEEPTVRSSGASGAIARWREHRRGRGAPRPPADAPRAVAAWDVQQPLAAPVPVWEAPLKRDTPSFDLPALPTWETLSQPKTQSVRSSYASSYALLPPEEANELSRLSDAAPAGTAPGTASQRTSAVSIPTQLPHAPSERRMRDPAMAAGFALRQPAHVATPELRADEWPAPASKTARPPSPVGALDELPPSTDVPPAAQAGEADSDSEESFEEEDMWRAGPLPQEESGPWTGVTRMRQAFQSFRESSMVRRASSYMLRSVPQSVDAWELVPSRRANEERAPLSAAPAGGEPQGETAGEALDDTAEDVYWLPHAKVTGDLSEQTDARQ